jgi:glutamyl-Q tRNA(Asp) synthetase
MRTRFAPSPTGPLHLGHAYSAWTAHDLARAVGGAFLLRIEDIDPQRSKPEWEAKIHEDLAWLGIRWDAPPLRQSERLDAYGAALDALWARGLLYACTCTRRDIAEALAAPQEGAARPADGPDGPVYPGTCRWRDRAGPRPTDVHLRLDAARALDALSAPALAFAETTAGDPPGRQESAPDWFRDRIGDVVLARRDFGTSYHLSVVVDDAHQGITDVVRGADLFEATPIHVLLQRLLGMPTPAYHHHPLIRDREGRRLAKRDDARAVAAYRADGWTPDALRAHLEGTLTAPDPGSAPT